MDLHVVNNYAYRFKVDKITVAIFSPTFRFHHPEFFLFLLMTQIGNFGIKISPDNYSRVSKGHIKKSLLQMK